MADRHIADKECEFIAVNGPPDFCKVGNTVVPFDITDTLDRARDPSGNVYARGANVLKVGTRVNTVDGDAGAGVVSGCSKGHTIVLSGSNSVFVNGMPVAYHGSKVGMNCNGGDTPNTSGELRTKVMPPKPKWGTKEAGQELKEKVKENRAKLNNNPMGKTVDEATALRDDVRHTINQASQHEQAAFAAVRNGTSSSDVLMEAMQTRQNAYNLLGEAERQVLYANPTSQAVVSGALGFVPGSGLVDAGKDAQAAYQAAGQGSYMSAAGSAGMAVVGAVSELPGLKQVKGLFKIGKTADNLNDAKKLERAAELKKAEEAKKLADAKKAEEAEKARQNGTVVEKKRVQKPHKDCGKVSTYKKAPKKLGELNADHIPSGAALKQAAEQKLKDMGVWRKLDPKQQQSVLNSVYNDAPTITVPEDVHKEGRTWGSKNKPLFKDDAGNLKGAFEKDAAEIQKSMDTKDHGCSDAYSKGVEQLRKFDYDKYIEDAVNKHKAVKTKL